MTMQGEIRPGYKQTEVGVIPEDWDATALSQLCRLVNGRGFKPHEWDTEGYPIIRIQNLNGSDEFNYYSGHFDPKILVENNQLLFAWSGSRGTSFGPHVWRGQAAVLNYHTWKVVTFEKRVAPDFFLHALKNLTKSIEDAAHGASALVHAQKKEMENYQIAIPSTDLEQRAIAAALGDVDALIATLEEMIAKKRALKQAAIQQLLTGKTRLPGFSGEWEVRRLGDCASFYKGKGLPKSAITVSGKFPCIHYGELFTFYGTIINEIASRTNECAGAFLSQSDDVLMPTSDVTPRGLAKASCLTVANVVLGGDTLVIRPEKSRLSGSFLAAQVRYREGQVLKLVTGSTVFHLYARDMKKFELPVPSIGEQVAIAEVLSDMDADLSALEAQLAKARAVKQGMMQELLTGRVRLV